MTNIHIICLGKLKESYWQEAEQEYLKRLSPFSKIHIHELREESFAEKDNVELIKEKEAEKILHELEKIPRAYIVSLDEHGKQLSSTEFSQKIDAITLEHNEIVFIIGGPLGLNEAIAKKANLLLSLSKMTFTHQMTRPILFEQIYRAFMISANRKYHY